MVDSYLIEKVVRLRNLDVDAWSKEKTQQGTWLVVLGKDEREAQLVMEARAIILDLLQKTGLLTQGTIITDEILNRWKVVKPQKWEKVPWVNFPWAIGGLSEEEAHALMHLKFDANTLWNTYTNRRHRRW